MLDRAIIAMTLATIACCGATGVVSPPPDTDLTSAAVEELCTAIRPGEEDTRWLQIPWRTSFWKGVQDSQIDGKPILLWAMNGHPLGCT